MLAVRIGVAAAATVLLALAGLRLLLAAHRALERRGEDRGPPPAGRPT